MRISAAGVLVWQLLCIVVIVDGSLMLDRPWNPFFFFRPFCCSRFRINNQKEKAKKKPETAKKNIIPHVTLSVLGKYLIFSLIIIFYFLLSLSPTAHPVGILKAF